MSMKWATANLLLWPFRPMHLQRRVCGATWIKNLHIHHRLLELACEFDILRPQHTVRNPRMLVLQPASGKSFWEDIPPFGLGVADFGKPAPQDVKVRLTLSLQQSKTDATEGAMLVGISIACR
jgi:hypothetical protein